MNQIDRFMQKVEKTAECWIWTARTTRQGYGRFFANGRNNLAHRVSYEMFVGVAGDMHVLHRCDNPSCVRPDHLFLGSNKDNVDDKVAKGRTPPAKGELNPHSRLKKEDVLKIRSMHANKVPRSLIAKEFAVVPAYINQIVNRKAWRHI